MMDGAAKRSRVLAALRGQTVDRVPFSVWMHNFELEVHADTFVSETVRLATRFDWDYLKPQVSAEQFPEMWGLKFRPGESPSSFPIFTHFPIDRAGDFVRLKPVSIQSGPLHDQLDS